MAKTALPVSDWFPHMGGVADEPTIARGMWTLDNNHGAEIAIPTGRKVTEGAFPTVGSCFSYGLGTPNRNLPEYVVLGNPSADCCGAAFTHGASYLGPRHAGAWDSHRSIKVNHSRLAKQVNQPVAGLIKDLKLRGYSMKP